MKLGLVVYRGEMGGAEIVTVELARALRRVGVDASVIFALSASAMGERLDTSGVPYSQVGLSRHRDVVYHPRRLARAVAAVADDGVILVECGHLGAALRAGGYHGRIVGVEHGPLLELGTFPLLRRLWLRAGRLGSAWADDIDVAVSGYMLEHLRRVPHARRLVYIHNGIDLADYPIPEESPAGGRVVIGSAGRLVAGKGFDVLLEALALVRERAAVVLRLAGDGPERAALELLAAELGVAPAVQFLGSTRDMPSFWASCDIAVTPSDTFPESFSMVTLEAMACGRAVVATRNGGIVELVVDGVTGTLVATGEAAALAEAVLGYVERPDLRAAHAAAARQRCVEYFGISGVAHRYRSLFEDPRHPATGSDQ
ncbi:MAG: glycosyltransferase family 4 protein [Acidimicrobiales bacterium]